ncbi:MAG: Alpha-tubulin suppressor [Aeromicrobium sp.]|nr:Alpha-tubulin suppressor [Aeromicrobium sp.]
MRGFGKILLCIAMILGLGGLTAISADASTSRSLSVKFSTKTPLTKSVVTVSGAITKTPHIGTTVTIQRKSGTTWKAAKSTKTTTSAGAYSTQLTVASGRGSYSYRAYVAKSGSLNAAISSTVKISVRSLQKVTLTANHSTIGTGSSVTLSGSVSPFKSKAKVSVQTLTPPNTWHTVSTRTLSSKGKFTYAPKPTTTTTYRVTSATQSTSYLAAGTSPSKTVTVIPTPIITTTTLPGGEQPGTPYSTQLATSLGRPGTWTRTSGALPAGLTLHTSGLIDGTPTGTNGASNFTVMFKDAQFTTLTASRSLSITIAAYTAPSISAGALPGGRVGVAYTGSATTTVSKPGLWTSGALPAGLSLNANTGAITGTPTAAGTSTPSFTFTEGPPHNGTDTKNLSITILAALPVITTTTLPSGTVGNAYTTTLLNQGNKTGTWAITAGSLPTGVTLNASTGVIGGTPGPGTANAYPITVTFTETSTSQTSLPKSLSLTIAAATEPVISTTSLPSGTVGTPYSATLATSGNKVGTWVRTGDSLPAGLSLAAGTGAITGTPTTPVTASMTFSFTQTSTGLTASTALSITIAPVPASITTTSLPNGALDTTYSQQLTSTGGTGTWLKTSGSLPSGLLLSSGGLISGKPGPTSTGATSFTVKFTTASGNVSQQLAITVDPFIASTGYPAGTVGVPYSFQLQTNGTGTGTWSSSIFGLPFDGLTLDANGLIHGTPTQAASGFSGFWPLTFTPDAAGYSSEELDADLTIEGNLGAGPAHTTISAGGQSACRIESTVASGAGTLWCWGANGNGQVDPAVAGSSSHFTTPHQVGTDATWTMVASSSFQNTCAVNAGHDLYCFGYNFSGQIGTGVQPDSLAQGKVAGTDWRYVSTGRDHTCAIKTDNSLFCWGQTSAIGVTTTHHDTPTQVNGAGWSMVSAGSGHTCGIEVDSTLWCWGSNGSGAIGDGTTTDAATPTQIGSAHWLTVSAGNGFVCAVKVDLTLWCWGANGTGQVGIGSTGSLVTTPTQVGSGNHWSSVSAGGSNATGFACAIKDDDTAWCWGNNGDGQLGIGNNVDKHSPTQVDGTTSWSSISAGGSTTCAVKNDESQRCWGSNGTLGVGQLGELGNGTSTGGGSTFPVTVTP